MPLPFEIGLIADDDANAEVTTYEEVVAEAIAPAPTYYPEEQLVPNSGQTYYEEPSGQTEYYEEPAPSTWDSGYFEQNTELPTESEVYYTDEEVGQSSTDYFNETLGAAPTPGEGTDYAGTNWFSDDPAMQTQQAAWWRAEVEKASAEGNEQKLNELYYELDTVNQAWESYMGSFDPGTDVWNPGSGARFAAEADTLIQGMNEAISTQAGEGPQTRFLTQNEYGDTESFLASSYYNDPMATGSTNDFYGNAPADRADVQGALSSGRDDRLAYRDYVGGRQDYYNIPDIAGFGGDPDAQAEFNELRGMAEMLSSVDDPMYGQTHDIVTGFIGRNAEPFLDDMLRSVTQGRLGSEEARFMGGSAAQGAKMLGTSTWNAEAPGLDGVSLGAGLSAAFKYGIEKPAITTTNLVTSLTRNVLEGSANMVRAVDAIIDGRMSDSRHWMNETVNELSTVGPISVADAIVQEYVGRSITGEAQQSRAWLDEHPWVDMAGQIVLDPWNLTGVGVIVKGANYGMKARFANRIMADVLPTLKPDEIKAFKDMGGLTWTNIVRLNVADNALYRSFGQGVMGGGDKFVPNERVIARSMVEKLGLNVKSLGQPEIDAIVGEFDTFAKRLLFRRSIARSTEYAKGVEVDVWGEESARFVQVLQEQFGTIDRSAFGQTIDTMQESFEAQWRIFDTNQTGDAVIAAIQAIERGEDLRTPQLNDGRVPGMLALGPGNGAMPYVETPTGRITLSADMERRVVGINERQPRGQLRIPENTKLPQSVMMVDEAGEVTIRTAKNVDEIVRRFGEWPWRITSDGRLVTKGQSDSERLVRRGEGLPKLRDGDRGPRPKANLRPDEQAPVSMPPTVPFSAKRTVDEQTHAIDTLVTQLLNVIPRTVQTQPYDGRMVQVSAPQKRIMDFFIQRDGRDYWAELMANPQHLDDQGNLTFSAVSRKLSEIHEGGADGTGRATFAQLQLLQRLDYSPTQLAAASQLSRDAALKLINEVMGGKKIATPDTSGFATIEKFANWNAEKAAKIPAWHAVDSIQAERAYRVGQESGVDLLQQWMDDAIPRVERDGGTRRMLFMEFSSDARVVATPAQKAFVDSLKRAGKVPKKVNINKITRAEATGYINKAIGNDSVMRQLMRGLDTRRMATTEDIQRSIDNLEVASWRDAVADAVERFIPTLNDDLDEMVKPQRRQGNIGRVDPAKSIDGTPQMSPFALSTAFAKRLPDFVGSVFHAPMEQMVKVIPYAKTGTNEASYNVADLFFNQARRGIIEAIQHSNASDEDIRAFYNLLHDAYYSDPVLKGAPVDSPEVIEKTVTSYQAAIPRIQEDLNQKNIPESRRALLEQQKVRMTAYIAEHRPDLITKRNVTKRQEAAQRIHDEVDTRSPVMSNVTSDFRQNAGTDSTVDVRVDMDTEPVAAPGNPPLDPYVRATTATMESPVEGMSRVTAIYDIPAGTERNKRMLQVQGWLQELPEDDLIALQAQSKQLRASGKYHHFTMRSINKQIDDALKAKRGGVMSTRAAESKIDDLLSDLKDNRQARGTTETVIARIQAYSNGSIRVMAHEALKRDSPRLNGIFHTVAERRGISLPQNTIAPSAETFHDWVMEASDIRLDKDQVRAALKEFSPRKLLDWAREPTSQIDQFYAQALWDAIADTKFYDLATEVMFLDSTAGELFSPELRRAAEALGYERPDSLIAWHVMEEIDALGGADAVRFMSDWKGILDERRDLDNQARHSGIRVEHFTEVWSGGDFEKYKEEYHQLTDWWSRILKDKPKAKQIQANAQVGVKTAGTGKKYAAEVRKYKRMSDLEEALTDYYDHTGVDSLLDVDDAVSSNANLIERLRNRVASVRRPPQIQAYIDNPPSPALKGSKERKRFLESVTLGMKVSNDIDYDQGAAVMVVMDAFAEAAVRNNPGRFLDVDEFYRGIEFKASNYVSEKRVDQTSHREVMNARGLSDDDVVRMAGLYESRIPTEALTDPALAYAGIGLITTFKGAQARTVLHEFAHHLQTLLTREQLFAVEDMLGITRGSKWTKKNNEQFVITFETFLAADGARLFKQHPPEIQGAFNVIRDTIRQIITRFVQYFDGNGLPRQSVDYWREVLDPEGAFYGGTAIPRLKAFGYMPTSTHPQYQDITLDSIAPPRQMRRANVIDPVLSALVDVDWNGYGAQLDAYIDEFYIKASNRMLDEQRGSKFNLWGRTFTDMTKMSQVMYTGDMIALDLSRFLTTDRNSIVDADGIIDYLAIERWIDDRIQSDIVKMMETDAFYASSKYGAETFRMWKKYGEDLKQNLAALSPAQSLGDLAPLNIPGADVLNKPRWGAAEFKQMDAFFSGKQRVPGGGKWADLTKEQQAALNDYRTAYKDAWNAHIKTDKRFYDNGEWQNANTDILDDIATTQEKLRKLRETRSAIIQDRDEIKSIRDKTDDDKERLRLANEAVRIAGSRIADLVDDVKRLEKAAKEERGWHVMGQIDDLVHGHLEPEHTVDLAKYADRIGSYVAMRFAEDIGFSADDVPGFLKASLLVKGQLTPLWMTMMPQYHLNNLAGNYLSQLIATMRSDLNATAAPWQNRRVKALQGQVGQGVPEHPYMRETFRMSVNKSVRVGNESNDPYGVISGLPKGIPAGLNWVLGGWSNPKKGAVSRAQNLATGVEDHFKRSIYTQEWSHTYAKQWSERVDVMVANGTIDPADVAKYKSAMGSGEVKNVMRDQGEFLKNEDWDDRERRILSQWNAASGVANHRAYLTTKDILRDYRMRNKFDGAMDRVFPVHFWATKNIAFMARTAADKPWLAINVMQGYDAWIEEMESRGLPPSLRGAYVPIPKSLTPWLDDDEQWNARISSLTNPIIWAVPRILGSLKGYENQSVMDRLMHNAGNGGLEAWRSLGYRPGPIWEYLVVRGSEIAMSHGPLKDTGIADAWLKATTTVMPFRNLDPSGLLQPTLSKNQQVQGWIETANTIAYGTPYTRNEIMGISFVIAGMEQRGELSTDPEKNHDAATTLISQLILGETDDPQLRKAIDSYFSTRGTEYMLGRFGGAAGITYNAQWKQQFEAGEDYKELQHPAMRWLQQERANGNITTKDYNAARQAAMNDKDHPLLKKAWTATEGLHHQYEQDAEMWVKAYDASAKYDELNDRFGIERANLWAFGSYNYQTGERTGANAMFLTTYWAAFGDTERAQNSLNYIRKKNATVAYNHMMNDYYDGRTLEYNAAAPYFTRMGEIADGRTEALIRAAEKGMNGEVNRILEEDAHTTYWTQYQRILDDAQRAGVNLAVGGSFPSHGNTFYDMKGRESFYIENPDTDEMQRIYIRGGAGIDRERGVVKDYVLTKPITGQPASQGITVGPNNQVLMNTKPVLKVVERSVRDTERSQRSFYHAFIEANDAMDEVDHYETAQRQQGYILDMVEDRIMPSRKDFESVDDKGFKVFDDEGYEKARQEAAQEAPALFRDYVQMLEESGQQVRISAGISPDDFLHHTRDSVSPELRAFQDTRDARFDKFYEMPSETKEDREKQAEVRQQLITDYGRDPFDSSTYSEGISDNLWRPGMSDEDDEKRVKALEVATKDRDYKHGTKLVNAYYHTMTPADKDAFRDIYGHAFVEKPSDYDPEKTYWEFVPENLSTEAMQDALARYDLNLYTTNYDKTVDGQTFRTEEDSMASSTGLGGGRAALRRGQRETSTEAIRLAESDEVKMYTTMFTEGAGMTDEQKQNRKDYHDFLERNGTLEVAANELRGTDTPQEISWKRAMYKARDEGMWDLAEYIEARGQKAFDTKIGETYDAERAWFQELPGDVKEMLLRENPATFGKLAKESDYTSSSSENREGDDQNENTSKKSGSSYTPYRSYSRSTSSGGSGRSSGSSARSGGSAASSTGEVTDWTAPLRALDPLLASGEDDGRGTYLQQISQYLNSMFTTMPRGKQQFGTGTFDYDNFRMLIMTSLMNWFRKKLGVSPTLDTWRLTFDELMSMMDQGNDDVSTADPAAPTAPPSEPSEALTPVPVQGGTAPASGSDVLGF